MERDDRLLDVFKTETKEKGVELWELWQQHEVKLLRIRLPYSQKWTLYNIPRKTLEKNLEQNKTAQLDDFDTVDF